MSWTIMSGRNDLPKIVITHESGSSAHVYLDGAQVMSWKTADDVERLFLSGAARFERGKPIRGGIPVVFPQFADSGPLVKHGWLRTTRWEVDDSADRSESFVNLTTRDTDDFTIALLDGDRIHFKSSAALLHTLLYPKR